MEKLTPKWRTEIPHELWGNLGGTWKSWYLAKTHKMISEELIEECEYYWWTSDVESEGSDYESTIMQQDSDAEDVHVEDVQDCEKCLLENP